MTSPHRSPDSKTNDTPKTFGIHDAAEQQPPSSQRKISSSEANRPQRGLRARAGSMTLGDNPARSHEGARVFPIRSVVSVDPTPSAQSRIDAHEGYFGSRGGTRNFSQSNPFSPPPNDSRSRNPAGASSRESSIAGPRRVGEAGTSDSGAEPAARKGSDGNAQYHVGNLWQGYQIMSEKGSEKSTSFSQRPPSRGGASVADEDTGGLVTARFKHVVAEGGHAVITGRDGETLQRCEDEPIHIPGAVQSFGALVAIEEDSEGRLIVRVVSENSKRVIGYTPRQLFALESFSDVLSDEQADNLLDHIDFVRDDGTDVEVRRTRSSNCWPSSMKSVTDWFVGKRPGSFHDVYP